MVEKYAHCSKELGRGRMDFRTVSEQQPLVAPGHYGVPPNSLPAGAHAPVVPVAFQTGGYAGAPTVVAYNGTPAVMIVQDAWGCALIGLILAFLIPLAGWITLCINANAPAGTKTRNLSIAAGVVGAIAFIVYFSVGYTTVHAGG
jgi:hypothetical protein